VSAIWRGAARGGGVSFGVFRCPHGADRKDAGTTALSTWPSVAVTGAIAFEKAIHLRVKKGVLLDSAVDSRAGFGGKVPPFRMRWQNFRGKTPPGSIFRSSWPIG